MATEQNTPRETPQYDSFVLWKSKDGRWWPYERHPTFAILLQIALGLGAGYTAYDIYVLGFWLSFLVAAGVGFGIGIGYNMLAGHMHWQKLNWLDLLVFGLPPYP